MINRNDLSPEDRAIYDASPTGAIDRVRRALGDVQHAIIRALPVWLTRCECHYHPEYGWVVHAGCRIHEREH